MANSSVKHGDRRRVVLTGLGPISAFGRGIEPLWEAMLEGRSAFRPFELFDASGFDCPFAATLSKELFDVRKTVPKTYRKAAKVMARDIELAVGAAAKAVEDGQLVTRATDPEAEPTIPSSRTGCHIGAGLIACDVDELSLALATSTDEDDEFDINAWGSTGMGNLPPLWLLKYLPNMLACHVTIIHDCQGPSNTITCAEAASGLSLGESMRVIMRGHADVCLSGGAESKINPMGVLRQQFAGRLAKIEQTEDPSQVIQPFSPNARGGILGEGGGILILEGLDSALSRGVTPIAELAGFAASQAMCPDMIGLVYGDDDESVPSAIRAALADACCSPDDIDAILPFGSSIPSMDQIDARAIQSVFGDRAASIPVITTVPYVGLCGAGQGALAASIAAHCIREQMLPARIGIQGEDSSGLNAGPCEARPASLRNILVFTTSVGGQNNAYVLRKVDAGEVSS